MESGSEKAMEIYRMHNPIVTDDHDLKLIAAMRRLLTELRPHLSGGDKVTDLDIKRGRLDFQVSGTTIMNVLIKHFPHPDDNKDA